MDSGGMSPNGTVHLASAAKGDAASGNKKQGWGAALAGKAYGVPGGGKSDALPRNGRKASTHSQISKPASSAEFCTSPLSSTVGDTFCILSFHITEAFKPTDTTFIV